MYSAEQNCNCLQEAGQTRGCSHLGLDTSPFPGNLFFRPKSRQDMNRHMALVCRTWPTNQGKPRPVTREGVTDSSPKCQPQCRTAHLAHQTSSKPNFWGRKELCFPLVTSTVPNTFPIKGRNTHFFPERCKPSTVMVVFSRSNPPVLNTSSWSEHCPQELRMPKPLKAQPTLGMLQTELLFSNFQAPWTT